MEELLGWASTLSADGCVPDADGSVAESRGRSHQHLRTAASGPKTSWRRGCLACAVESKFISATIPWPSPRMTWQNRACDPHPKQ